MEEIMWKAIGIFAVLLAVFCIVLAVLDDSDPKGDAIKECGSEENVVTHYDSVGEAWYTCK